MFADVLSLLMDRNALQPGEVLRTRRCNKIIHETVTQHAIYWKAMAQKVYTWKKRRSNAAVISSMRTRCRECGNSKPTRVLTSNFNSVLVCVPCTNSKHGYSQLLSRQEIFELNLGWSVFKIRNRLMVARKRRGAYMKFFYWRCAVTSPQNNGQSRPRQVL